MTNKLNEQLKKMHNLSKVIDENYSSNKKTEEEIMSMIDKSIEIQRELMIAINQSPGVNKEKLRTLYAKKLAEGDLLYPGNTLYDKYYDRY